MRRPVLLFLALACGSAPSAAAPLPPSADPTASFIAVADSVFRSGGEDGLAAFVKDNGILVGSAVAKLLDTAFQMAQQGDAAGEKENLAFARRVAAAHEAAGGTAVARALVDTYSRWTASQRKLRATAIKLEEDAGAARTNGDIPGAVAQLEQARALYEKIGDRHSVAVNRGTMGVVRWGAGDWDAVIADYEQALVARREVEDRILEGRTLNGLGTAHQQKGEYDRSAEYFRQAIDLRTRTGDLTGLGTSLTYLGHGYYYTGRYVDARNQYEKALPILAELENPRQMVELLTGIAAVNTSMGRMEDSNEAYRRGIELAAQNGLGGHELLCRRNLADNYKVQGRYEEALDELEIALRLLETNPDPTEQMLVYRTRGATYMGMGEREEARDDLLKSAALARQLNNPVHVAGIQTDVGYLYRDLGAFERGLEAADEARRMAEQAGDGRRYRDAVVLRAILELRMGRYEESLASFEEALAQDQADQAASDALADEVGIASNLAAMGRTAEARSRLRALLPRARAERLPEMEWSILLGMGQSFEKENADSAAFYYEAALARVETTGEQGGASATRTGYLSSARRAYYEEIARFFAKTHAATRDPRWSDRAFRTMERAKARGLLEMLQSSVAGNSSPEEDAALDALYSLDPKSPRYADERAAIEKRYTDLRRARVTAAMGTLDGGRTVAGIEDVARSLPKKTVLLEYALGDSASYLWVVDRNGHELVTLPARPAIEGEVRRMRDAIASVQGGEAALLNVARSLYTTLVAPAAARLGKAETVLIVPDGGLFELPFEALLSADAASGEWRAQPFFARSHATLYAPSATVYVSVKSRERHDDFARDLLAVGNPDFSTLAPNGGAPLEPLPFAEAEVDAIGARVKASRRVVLTGTGASEASVKHELRSAPPRVVHLATHGLVDAGEPVRSSVALSASDGEDGYFYTLEILSTPTPGGLVVMSACESARGRLSRGEGVVGLSRAFLASGTESVVASLWAVSDESTAVLMKAFYEGMFGKKRSASRALNEARLALIEGGTYSHPFYWSPFIVTGTERSPW
jgi:CHAT domain-containing protein/tetratricopeptide (TPR) repeat protein